MIFAMAMVVAMVVVVVMPRGGTRAAGGGKAGRAQAGFDLGQGAGQGLHVQLARAQAKAQPPQAVDAAQRVADLGLFGRAVHVRDAVGPLIDGGGRVHDPIGNSGATPGSSG